MQKGCVRHATPIIIFDPANIPQTRQIVQAHSTTKSRYKKVPMKRSMNIWVSVATVLQLLILVYNHIKETFLLFIFEGNTPKRLLISDEVMKSLTLILSPPNFKPVMAEKS